MSRIKDNALSVTFLALFLVCLAGQGLAGMLHYNERQLVDGGQAISYLEYVTSSSFAVDVAENWQSEYLQFLLFIMFTIWMVQRGSPESKEPGKEGAESDEEQQIGRYAGADSPAWARVKGWRIRVKTVLCVRYV